MGHRRSHMAGRNVRRRQMRAARTVAQVPVGFVFSGVFLLMGLMLWVAGGATARASWRVRPDPLLVGRLLRPAFRPRRLGGVRRPRFAAGTAPLPRRAAP